MTKVTIITPTYNVEKHIAQCILSVGSQKYKNFEHLILDNKSSDGTRSIVEKYQKKFSNLKFYSKKDRGIYNAMNQGIKYAKGEWLYFLGADDSFFDNSVLQKLFGNREHERFDFIYGDVEWGETGKMYDGRFTEAKLFDKNICHQAIFIRKSLLLKFDGFDESFKILADWMINFRCFADDDIRKKYVSIPIAKYSLNGLSSTANDQKFLENRKAILQKYLSPELNALLQKISELESRLETMRTSAAFRLGSYILNPSKIFNLVYFYTYKKHIK